MIRIFLNIFFNEVVYIPIWLHERFHPNEPYEKDSYAIKNRHDVIQSQFWISFFMDTSFVITYYVNSNGIVKEKNRDLFLMIIFALFVFYLSVLLVKYMKRTKYVENLMDKYFTYSKGYRKCMGYFWLVKYVLLVLSPFIFGYIFIA